MNKKKRASPAAAPFADQQGQGLVEYALILVLVAIVVIAILLLLGPVIGNVFSEVTQALQDPASLLGSGPIESISVSRAGDSVHVFVTVSESALAAAWRTSGASSSKAAVRACSATAFFGPIRPSTSATARRTLGSSCFSAWASAGTAAAPILASETSAEVRMNRSSWSSESINAGIPAPALSPVR